MYFQQKLRILTTLFKLSNSKLARGINVDASLVSRWKSGERKISPTSPHIPALATYFLRLNAYQYQKAYLDRIISAHLSEEEQTDETRRIHVLADWLISDESPEVPGQSEQANQLTSSAALIANMADLLSVQNGAQVQTSAAPSVDKEESASAAAQNSGYETCEPLIYRGRPGRRDSVLYFLKHILATEIRQDLLLLSEDDMGWLMENPDFTREWALLLKRVIEAGHKITIVHVVNRRAGEIMNVLNYWMPLHLAGQINSFYYPRYIEREIRQTMFIARNTMALVSTTTADFGNDEMTHIFTDEASVNSFTLVYDYFIKECKPLFSVYSRQQAENFYSKMLAFREKGSAAFNIRHTLNLMGLPADILAQVESQIDVIADHEALADWFRQHQEAFRQKLLQNWYVDIYPYSMLEQIMHSRQASLPRNEIFSTNNIYLSTSATIVWLKNLIRLLRDYDNYQICFAPSTPGLESIKVNINYKENLAALFSTELPEGRSPLTVMLSEANILHALSHYFHDFIQKIPSSLRQKDEVIDRLTNLVEYLEHEKNPLG